MLQWSFVKRSIQHYLKGRYYQDQAPHAGAEKKKKKRVDPGNEGLRALEWRVRCLFQGRKILDMVLSNVRPRYSS